MRQLRILCFLTILTACSSNEGNPENGSAISDTLGAVQTENTLPNAPPVKTVIGFLKWYRNKQDIQGSLVNNVRSKTYDSTKYYSVNFEMTEKYLSGLKSTGFISDAYIEKWRAYFKKREKNFKENPSDEGPPEGFEYDFIMLSQEYDDDLKAVEKSEIVSQSVLGNKGTVKIHFPYGHKLIYKLTKHSDKWLIDDIESE